MKFITAKEPKILGDDSARSKTKFETKSCSKDLEVSQDDHCITTYVSKVSDLSKNIKKDKSKS